MMFLPDTIFLCKRILPVNEGVSLVNMDFYTISYILSNIAILQNLWTSSKKNSRNSFSNTPSVYLGGEISHYRIFKGSGSAFFQLLIIRFNNFCLLFKIKFQLRLSPY